MRWARQAEAKRVSNGSQGAYSLMIQLHTLGLIEARGHSGEPLEDLSRQAKLIAVLTYLAVEGADRAVSTETLLDTFWPDSPPARARRTLSQHLHVARHTHGVDVVERVRGGWIRIRPGRLRCDATDLLTGDVDGRWVLENYRGELLPGLRLPGCDRLDDWLDRTRANLRMRAVELLAAAASEVALAGASAQDAELVLRLARRALELDPYHQTAAVRAVEALGAVRGRPEAWRFYKEYRSRVVGDLDLGPSSELVKALTRVCATEYPVLPGLTADIDHAYVVGVAAPPRKAASRALRRLLPVAVLVGLAVLVSEWIKPRRTVAGGDVRPTAEILIDRGGQNVVWRAVVSAELAKYLGDRGAQIVHERRGNAGAGVIEFTLGAALHMDSDVVSGAIHLTSARSRGLIGSWRLDAPKDELPGRIATIGDSVRVAMGRWATQRRITEAAANPSAINALVRARTELTEARTATSAGAFEVSMRRLRLADSLAAAAARLDHDWSQPDLVRAEILQSRALLDIRLGGTSAAHELVREAVTTATRAIELGAGFPGFERRGELYYLAWMLDAPLPGDLYAAAVDDLNHVVSTDYASSKAWTMVSGLYHAVGRYRDAYHAATNAMAVDAFGEAADAITARLFLASFNAGMDYEARHWCSELERRSPGRWTTAECQLSNAATSGEGASARVDAVDLTLRGESPEVARAMRPRLDILRATALAMSGERDRARTILNLLSPAARHDPEILVVLAFAHAQIGDLTKARNLVADYVGDGPTSRRALLHSRWLAPLHDEAGSAAAFIADLSGQPRRTTGR
jgi:DNA-binding SARP family transcriptional activator/tetratricopeptide (TPR) repeat protein